MIWATPAASYENLAAEIEKGLVVNGMRKSGASWSSFIICSGVSNDNKTASSTCTTRNSIADNLRTMLDDLAGRIFTW